jgi:hypothetical protein
MKDGRLLLDNNLAENAIRPIVDNPEHTHPLSGIISGIQKESIFFLNPDICQISTQRCNNM